MMLSERSLEHAASAYVSYLWLGECVHNPQAYAEADAMFNEERNDYYHETTANLEQPTDTAKVAVLLDQLKCVTNWALSGLEFDRPLSAKTKAVIQVQLGQVAALGTVRAHENGLYEDYPKTKSIRSPFQDAILVAGILRYRRTGSIHGQLQNYATIERVLPGYPSN